MMVPKPIRKKKAKKKSANKSSANKKKCVELAKKIVRKNGVCLICGRSKAQGYQIHGAHILSVKKGHTAADLRNIIPLCAFCHSVGPDSQHQCGVNFTRWLDSNYPGLYDFLYRISENVTRKPDWESIYEGLKVQAKLEGVK